MSGTNHDGPVVLCFDGSDDATNAIAEAARVLGPRPAVVVTVREPIELWTPYDPATILDAGIAKLASKPLGLDEIADEIAQRQLDTGVELAHAAGLQAQGHVACGKPRDPRIVAGQPLCVHADEHTAPLHNRPRDQHGVRGAGMRGVHDGARRIVDGGHPKTLGRDQHDVGIRSRAGASAHGWQRPRRARGRATRPTRRRRIASPSASPTAARGAPCATSSRLESLARCHECLVGVHVGHNRSDALLLGDAADIAEERERL